MTIEEKAKAYDEAIERGKQIQTTPYTAHWDIMKEVAEHLLPELKESEDERIIKDIVTYLKSDIANKGYRDKIIESWIAWLEKQCSQIPANSAKTCKDEQKPIKEHNVCDFCEDRYGCVNPCPTKLIEEQKPADKVKPKFHEGEWVVYDHRVYQVVELPKEGYINLGLKRNGKIEFAPSTYCSSWTIQDAKDGDVLYLQKDGKEHIIIYKGVLKERFRTFVSAYCAYNGIVDAFCFADVSRYVDIAYRGIMPATKEQRDTLMKAMTDAGYTFDFEKKELKKIVVPIFKIGDTIIKKHNSDILYFGSFTITDITGGKYWYNDRIICDITEQDEWEIYEPVSQKSAEWSERDELHLRELESLVKQVWTIAEHENDKDTIHKMSDLSFFLKTLKPQPKQEWSEEDERIRKDIVTYLKSVIANKGYRDKFIESWIAWLEKQGEKGTKGNDREIPFDAWSEEDDEHLGRILKELESQRQRPFNRPYLDKIESDYNWLKSLKNRYTWKPSDEQMDMLAKVCSTLHLTSGENEIMESIYDALKKLMEE